MATMVNNLVGSVGAMAVGAVSATAAYYYMTDDEKAPCNYNMNVQSLPVDVSILI